MKNRFGKIKCFRIIAIIENLNKHLQNKKKLKKTIDIL